MQSPSATSWQVGPDLFLNHHTIALGAAAAAQPTAPEPTHHVIVLDVSGSMYSDLPLIREQLKSRLPTLLGEDDTITIIWFSGRGECGILFEAVKPTLKDLADINRAIDRWLRPVGLTGFKEPLMLVQEVAARLVAKYKAPRISLFFMSDGCDNVWRRDEILTVMSHVGAVIAASTMVMYGYYADQPFLTKMAEKSGGCVILAQDFKGYEPTFEAAMKRRAPAAKKTTVKVAGDPIGGFVFALDGAEVLTFEVDSGKATVPAHVTDVFYMTPQPAGSVRNLTNLIASSVPTVNDSPGLTGVLSAAYASASLYAQRISPKIVWALLRVLGDVRLIEEFAMCFGKQRYGEFVATTKAAAFGDGRFVRGYDPKRAPKEDAFTVLDLFDLLSRNEGCCILTASDAFQYTRIGRKAVDKGLMLTVTEGKAAAELADEIKALCEAREVAPMLVALDKLDAILRNRKRGLKFASDTVAAEKGYHPDLVWNETMPNLSFRVYIPGFVNLAEIEMPDDVRAKLPGIIPTFMFRTYTVVKDGLVHLEWLPVVVPRDVFDTLVAVGVVDPNVEPWTEVDGGMRGVLDMRKVPVINQKMVNEVSARSMAEKAWKLLTLKAEAKVWKHYTPERESKGFATVYGAAAATWLDDNGITDHSGFKIETTAAPPAPPVDFDIGRALDVKIPGYSSLPSVKEVRERMEAMAAVTSGKDAPAKKGKAKEVTPAGKLMVPALCEVDALMASPFYAKAANKDAFLAQWVGDKAKATVAETRKLQTEIAKLRFTTLVGGTWFFPTFEEKSIKLDLGGEAREVTFDLDESVKLYR